MLPSDCGKELTLFFLFFLILIGYSEAKNQETLTSCFSVITVYNFNNYEDFVMFILPLWKWYKTFLETIMPGII